jgi:hypothetical protein
VAKSTCKKGKLCNARLHFETALIHLSGPFSKCPAICSGNLSRIPPLSLGKTTTRGPLLLSSFFVALANVKPLLKPGESCFFGHIGAGVGPVSVIALEIALVVISRIAH